MVAQPSYDEHVDEQTNERPNRTFEELDYRPTPLGDLILRLRRPGGGDAAEVYEITLDGAFLMSSLVNTSEVALARRALAAAPARPLDVLVGGLGLGHTAKAALEDGRVASVTVVERLAAVIDWHREGLVPLGRALTSDPRCHLVEGDVFARLGPATDEAPHDIVLLDVDHSPRAWLDPSHAVFYEVDGLRRLATRIRPDGVFGLWSADAPDPGFLERLEEVFESAWAETVRFFNPHVSAEDVNTIYVARRGS